MRSVFDRECTKKDYNEWSLIDTSNGFVMCVLGRKDVFERRISRSNCYNGINYDRPISSSSCPCTRDDYECDFGFMTDKMDPKKCTKDPELNKPLSIPMSCRPGQMYNRTKGYRKVPGDECIREPNSLFEPELYPCPLK